MVKSMWSDTATHDQGNDHREKPGDQSQLHPVHSTRQMSNLVAESTDLTAKLIPQSSDLSAELLLGHQLGRGHVPTMPQPLVGVNGPLWGAQPLEFIKPQRQIDVLNGLHGRAFEQIVL